MKRFGIAVLFSLVVVATTRADDFRPELNEETIASSLRTQWYGVQINGQKIGNYRTNASRTKSEILEASEMRMKITAQGKQTEIEVRKRVWFSATKPHALLRAEEESITPNGTERAVLRTVDGKWRLEVTAGTRRFEKEIAALDFAYADSLAAEIWIRSKPEVGARVQYRSLSVDSANVSTETMQVMKIEGKDAARILDIKIDFGKDRMPVNARFDAQGNIVLGRIGQLELHRETEAEAKKIAHGDDLFNLGFVKIDQALGQLKATNSIAFEVVGVDNTIFDLGPHQALAQGNRLIVGKDKGQREKATAESIKLALQESIDLPIQDARIRKLSEQAIGKATTVEAKAALILGFVNGYMRPEMTADNPDIDNVLKTRKGDCKAYARLFNALARSAGVPTREITGLAYMGDDQRAYAGHAWNEVALNGVWIPVDAVAASMDASVTHVRVKNLAAILGKTSFKVVDSQ